MHKLGLRFRTVDLKIDRPVRHVVMLALASIAAAAILVMTA